MLERYRVRRSRRRRKRRRRNREIPASRVLSLSTFSLVAMASLSATNYLFFFIIIFFSWFSQIFFPLRQFNLKWGKYLIEFSSSCFQSFCLPTTRLFDWITELRPSPSLSPHSAIIQINQTWSFTLKGRMIRSFLSQFPFRGLRPTFWSILTAVSASPPHPLPLPR